jgi:hypothetical protein
MDRADRPALVSAGPIASVVESEQVFALPGPVVASTPAGARQLGSVYWKEVERSTRGAVRPRWTGEGLELRLLGCTLPLLCFGMPQIAVSPLSVSCTYPILGGVLARGAGGELVLAHMKNGGWTVRTAVGGFLPRLAARPGYPSWTGLLYHQVQVRLHAAIARRYVSRLVRESRR